MPDHGPLAPTAVGSPLPSPARLREVDLHTLWLEQRFPAGALTTVGGEPVRVLYRGSPGRGAGPDFRDARISVGGAAPRLGDVELHVAAADFRRHGHAMDPAYARVLLHVVFDADGERSTALPGGGIAPVLALRPWVERRSAEIQLWLESSLPWREPCHSAIERLGAGAVRRLLVAHGEARLRRKATALATGAGADGSEQVLYRAICGALGLSRNVLPFTMLANRLPIAALLRQTDVADDTTPAAAQAALRERLRDAGGFGSTPAALGALPWQLHGLRPAAHPAKRIDALAVLIARHRRGGLVRALRAAAERGADELLGALRVPGIGRDRAVEIAVNAVCPFLIVTGDEALGIAIARGSPAATAYGSLTLLSSALTVAPPERPVVSQNALAQQGALALRAEWCCSGGCGVCPLS